MLLHDEPRQGQAAQPATHTHTRVVKKWWYTIALASYIWATHSMHDAWGASHQTNGIMMDQIVVPANESLCTCLLWAKKRKREP